MAIKFNSFHQSSQHKIMNVAVASGFRPLKMPLLSRKNENCISLPMMNLLNCVSAIFTFV